MVIMIIVTELLAFIYPGRCLHYACILCPRFESDWYLRFMGHFLTESLIQDINQAELLCRWRFDVFLFCLCITCSFTRGSMLISIQVLNRPSKYIIRNSYLEYQEIAQRHQLRKKMNVNQLFLVMMIWRF